MSEEKKFVSQEDLLGVARKATGIVSYRTEKEKKILLAVMSHCCHPAIRLSATRLLNTLYEFNLSDEFVEFVSELWNHYRIDEVLRVDDA